MAPPVQLLVLLCLAIASVGCRGTGAPAPLAGAPVATQVQIPDGPAGELLQRAIAAHGGREAWQSHRDASFISTLTVFDPRGNATSETIFLHKMILHEGCKGRLESIGLEDEIIFGLNGADSWMLRAGQLVSDERSTAFIHFDAVSAEYWFQMPFVAAEIPAQLSYEGPATDGSRRWEKVRFVYDATVVVPVNWVVAYVNGETGLIDRLFFEVRTGFLQQKLWRAELSEFRQSGGILRERRREYFPVDESDRLLGTRAAQQIVEHIRFENGFTPELFQRPPPPAGARTLT